MSGGLSQLPQLPRPVHFRLSCRLLHQPKELPVLQCLLQRLLYTVHNLHRWLLRHDVNCVATYPFSTYKKVTLLPDSSATPAAEPALGPTTISPASVLPRMSLPTAATPVAPTVSSVLLISYFFHIFIELLLNPTIIFVFFFSYENCHII